MTKENKEECTCCIEYDEDCKPVECLCPKHRKQRELKLKNEYLRK